MHIEELDPSHDARPDAGAGGSAASGSRGLPGRIEQVVEERLGAAVERAAEHVPAAVKPRLRGWLHAGAVPVVLVAGIVLVALSRGTAEVVASAIYAVTTVLLFSVSAVYHRGRWTGRTHAALQRIDHANIFLLIAGTYTPFAVLLLAGGQRTALLVIVWGAALLGVGFRLVWVHAPGWLWVPAYIVLGWLAVWYLPDLMREGGVAMLVLITVGGVLYTLGAIVFATKQPDPYPAWFGFHEVFHTLTLLAYVCQYIAVSLVVYSH
jgi:hemolysin III